MTPAKVAEELHHPVAQELLSSARIARLAYVGEDGLPRVVPLGFLWDAGRIVVCTATIAPKVAALKARPNVALTIDADGSALQSLQIRGVAAVEIVDGVPPEYLAASRKAMEVARNPDFEARVRSLYRQMAKIAITPRWAHLYDFARGRVPEFLSRLAGGG
jgi:hypothetical protein